MYKVGIFAPYVRNEVTLAATQFADWLVRLGMDVTYLTRGNVESGIHNHWDKHVVKHSGSGSTCRWAYGASHLCWFVPDVKVYHQSKLVDPVGKRQYTRNFYLPSWDNWTAQSKAFLTYCDKVICLSRDMGQWLDDKMPEDCIQGQRSWLTLASPKVPLSFRHGRKEAGAVHLLAVLPKTVEQDIGDIILDVFDFLLATHENLELKVIPESSLPRQWRRKGTRMSKLHEGRLTLHRPVDYSKLGDHVREADWVYVCNTRHKYGSLLSELSAYSVPMIAHDLPPVCGYVNDRINGRLIACQLHGRYPIAEVSPDDIGEVLDSVLAEDSLYLKSLQLQSRKCLDRNQRACGEKIMQEFLNP
tara:strand:- start:2249 stop:3325 length:1077 start_codon:yes stop_codon:yes gene_type:complete